VTCFNQIEAPTTLGLGPSCQSGCQPSEGMPTDDWHPPRVGPRSFRWALGALDSRTALSVVCFPPISVSKTQFHGLTARQPVSGWARRVGVSCSHAFRCRVSGVCVPSNPLRHCLSGALPWWLAGGNFTRICGRSAAPFVWTSNVHIWQACQPSPPSATAANVFFICKIPCSPTYATCAHLFHPLTDPR